MHQEHTLTASTRYSYVLLLHTLAYPCKQVCKLLCTLTAAAAGLLFDASMVPTGWIRVGAVLFTVFGMQYLGTAFGDWQSAAASSRNHTQYSWRGTLNTGSSQSTSSSAASLLKSAKEASAVQSGGMSSTTSVTAAVDARLQPRSMTSASTSPLTSSIEQSSATPAGNSSSISVQQDGFAQHSSNNFYAATVWSRLFLALAFSALVLTGQSQRTLLVLAALNLWGAVSTWSALKSQAEVHVMGRL